MFFDYGPETPRPPERGTDILTPVPEQIEGRRKFLVGMTCLAPVAVLPTFATANPLIWFGLRFIFGRGLRSALRLPFKSLKKNGGRAIRRLKNGRVARVGVGAAVATAPQTGWTQEFVLAGLEEMMWQKINPQPLEGDFVEIPEGAFVLDRQRDSGNIIRIEIENKTDERLSAILNCFLYDIDSGVVEFKFQDIFVGGIHPRQNVFASIPLVPIPEPGRKILAIKHESTGIEVSDVFFVM